MSSESTIEKASKKTRAASKEVVEDRDEDRDDELEDEDESRDDDEGDDDDDEDNGSSKAKAKAEPEPPPRAPVEVNRPSAFSLIMTIARREFAGYFNSPLAYIVIGISMVLLGGYFFFYKGGFWQVDRATMARMFEVIPVALCFLTIPLFTMRSLAEEKRLGTMELLITMPVKDSEVILGKYFASLGMVALQIALVAIYPLVMFIWPWQLGPLDWNPFWTGMLGLVVLSSAGVAIGMMYSSVTESQIIAYFATMVTLVGLYAIGTVTLVEYLSGWPGDALSFISFQTRYDPFARGLIDTRAIVYFVSIAVLCLLVAFRNLESRKWK
ncbi:MAG: ABC transporter permease subunit [Myxococcales bacterium]|nr:ABC transporter permease subunit [Myxococcales bacterium]